MDALFGLILVLVVIGLLLYLVQMLPIDAKIKQLVLILVIIFAIVWILGTTFGPLPHIRIR